MVTEGVLPLPHLADVRQLATGGIRPLGSNWPGPTEFGYRIDRPSEYRWARILVEVILLARIKSAAVIGVDAYPVDVEVDLGRGLPSLTTVGLPHGAIKEGRERVTAALTNSGFELPLNRITINLAPADVPKAGSAFDLPIAIGILVASGQIKVPGLSQVVLFGELGLEGDLRPVRGSLSLAACAIAIGAREVVLPAPNGAEAAMIDGIAIVGAPDLRSATGHLSGRKPLPASRRGATEPVAWRNDVDFAEVRGQALARRAIEVAAAGRHNVLMVGPPGAGKTMLARRIPTILPPLTSGEAIEVAKIHSVAGLLSSYDPVRSGRPFRAPHHSVSDAGMAGGGSHPRPGEVSLAHHGVLFLDEFPEFRRHALESLRQPLEDGVVVIARAAMSLTFPARFMLVAAMNPCPCGFRGDPARQCTCTEERVERYRGRISGPILDRIDIHLTLPSVSWAELSVSQPGESSATIRERITVARERQAHRYRDCGGVPSNAHLAPKYVERYCRLDREGGALLSLAMKRLGLTARSYTRLLRVARTVADLEGVERIEGRHVAEAVQYRSPERSEVRRTGDERSE